MDKRHLVSLMGVAAGCSFLLDRSTTQCTTDTDCLRFDAGYPLCQEGVCVPSGLGPAGCFDGDATTSAELENQCTTAQCLPFDNCGRLTLCGAQLDGGLDAIAPPPPDGGGLSTQASVFDISFPPVDAGVVPPLVDTETPPAVRCADVSPNVLYVTGTSNFPPLVEAVQPFLLEASPAYTIIFLQQNSCLAASEIYDPDPAKHVIQNEEGNWPYFYDADGNLNYCSLADGGVSVDVGVSDVYPETCGYQESANVADYSGPVEAVTFVVPAASSQTSISAEAAHLVFGAGGNDGQAAPWVDPSLYFIRASNTGTVQLPSLFIGVDASAWWGIAWPSPTTLLSAIQSIDPASAEGAIGVLFANWADSARSNLRILAFQQPGATCGYLPDSTATSFDKQNVRDGHYPVWGHLHLMTATTQSHVPSEAAAALVTHFSVPALDQRFVDALIGTGVIPQCAMGVERAVEAGPVETYTPQYGCGCYFESVVNGATSCQACQSSAQCPAALPACNYGYCELQ